MNNNNEAKNSKTEVEKLIHQVYPKESSPSRRADYSQLMDGKDLGRGGNPMPPFYTQELLKELGNINAV